MPNSHVSMDAEQVSDNSFEDDTLPPLDDVQAEFRDKAVDIAGAFEFLADLDIDADVVTSAVGKIALIEYAISWNPLAGRYQFAIGEGEPDTLAVPILEGGQFVDLLLIADDLSFGTVCGGALWLGRDHLAAPVVRLHASPLDWLRGLLRGRLSYPPLQPARSEGASACAAYRCNDMTTALEAWDWAFGADDGELGRFDIDASPESIREYFDSQARYRASIELAPWHRERRAARRRVRA